CQHNYGSPFTF
nr:immunoglobulin light chain junction region [Macaca mulatta]MOX48749.1 immunoglobulin light chain junction region [Macaca mulatta]MOX50814.1 immunoglobulin light chain junction region [Macaca mulatta]MOX50918.1 immunoglobulin light chain junction region [Macaca mulatta]